MRKRRGILKYVPPSLQSPFLASQTGNAEVSGSPKEFDIFVGVTKFACEEGRWHWLCAEKPYASFAISTLEYRASA
jgi:hypothetical protein